MSGRRFVERALPMEAMLVTEDNMAEVAEWLGGEVLDLSYRLPDDGPKVRYQAILFGDAFRSVKAYVGQYAVRREVWGDRYSGATYMWYDTVPAADFEARYAEVTP